MASKLNGKKTSDCEDRIKSLEERLDGTIERLDAALAESKRLGKALEELQQHDHMGDLRKTLKKRFGARRAGDMLTYDPDETVN